MQNITDILKNAVPPVTKANYNIEINNIENKNAKYATNEYLGAAQMFPVTIKKNANEIYVFKVEPIVSFSGKNIISKRTVAKSKGKGSIKERWAVDDWQIELTGYLVGDNDYPDSEVTRLISFLQAPQALEIECRPLKNIGVNSVVVEDYDFPFDPVSQRQKFEIKLVSDNDLPLFIEVKNNA
jgi:hypothetical protein